LYESPASAFVADFIGETSFIAVSLTPAGQKVRAAIPDLGLQQELPAHRVLTHAAAGRLAIRPEHVSLSLAQDGSARVIESAYAGTTQVVLVQVGAARILARTQMSPDTPLYQAGQSVHVGLDTAHSMVYPLDA